MKHDLKWDGSITIYMTLMFSILLSLFLTLIDGARRNAICMQAECAFDLAVYSTFAEYNRELLSQYDLLFIDCTYGQKVASIKEVERHFSYYMNENLSTAQKGKNAMAVDFTRTFLEYGDLSELSFATDDNGKVFEHQAISYMEQKYGISYILELQNNLEKARQNNLFTRDIASEREANQSIIEEIKNTPQVTEELDEDGKPITREITIDNPADSVNASRSRGILLLVTEAKTELSLGSINQALCVSNRQHLFEGKGLHGRKENTAGEKMLFDAYVLDHCGTYLNPKQEGQLQYQTEYVIAGKDNDIDNLKAVVTRLLLLRETANFTYLLSDVKKQAEAETLAAAVTSAAGVPILLEPVKLSILFAWAYAESVYDVKMLLKEKRVPILKTAESWHFSLEGMLQYESMLSLEEIDQSAADENASNVSSLSKDGLNYTDYLRLFLAVENRQNKVNRMMDVVESDIRKTEHNAFFCLDACIDKIKFVSSVGSKYGYSYELERVYYYK